MPAGSPLARFDLDGSADADLTLTVYRVAGPTDLRYYERWLSTATATGDRVTLVDPVAGSYLVVANVAAAREGSTWDLTAAIVDPRAGGSLTAEPGALVTTAGEEAYGTSTDGAPEPSAGTCQTSDVVASVEPSGTLQEGDTVTVSYWAKVPPGQQKDDDGEGDEG